MSFPHVAIAKARYRSPPTDAHPFSFDVGDEVQVLGLADEEGDWFNGRVGTKEGVFPATSVQPVVVAVIEEEKPAAQEKDDPVQESIESPAPTPTPVAPAPPAPTSPTSPAIEKPLPKSASPQPPTKPTSLKERIAALNAAGAGAVAPGAPPKPPGITPKGKPFVFKKPTLPLPPSSPVASSPTVAPAIKIEESQGEKEHVPLARSSSREKDGEGMSASDAAASISKAGSLRERIAALQGLKLETPGVPGRAPKVFKKKSVDVPVENEASATATTVEEVGTKEEGATKEEEETPTAPPILPLLSLPIPSSSPSTSSALSPSESSALSPSSDAVTTTSPLSAAPLGSAGGMVMPSIPRRAGPPRRKTPSPAVSVAVPAVATSEEKEEEKEGEKEGEEKVEEKEVAKAEDALDEPEHTDIPSAEPATAPSPLAPSPSIPPPSPDSPILSEPPATPAEAIADQLAPTVASTTEQKVEEASTNEKVVVEEKKSTRPPIPASFAQTRKVPMAIVEPVEAEDEQEEEVEEEEEVKGEEIEEVEEEQEVDQEELVESDIPSPAPQSIEVSPPPAPTRSAPPPSRQLPPLQLLATNAPPSPSRDAPPTPTVSDSKSPLKSSVDEEDPDIKDEVAEEKVSEVVEEEKEEEEDSEVARRAALAKRMAKLGGMKMGMFPIPSFAPKSPLTRSAPSPTTDRPKEKEQEEEVVLERVPGSIPKGGVRLPFAPLPPRSALPSLPPANLVEPEEIVVDEEVDVEEEEEEEEELVEEELEEEEEEEAEAEAIAPPLPLGRPSAPPIITTDDSPIPDEPTEAAEATEADEEEEEEEEEIEADDASAESAQAPPPPPRSYPRPLSAVVPPTPSSGVPRGSLPPLPSAGTGMEVERSEGGGGLLDSVIIPSGGMYAEEPSTQINDEPSSPLPPTPSSPILSAPTQSERRMATATELERFSSTLGAQIFAAAHLRLNSKAATGGGGGGPEFIEYCFSRAPDALNGSEGGVGVVQAGSTKFNGHLIYSHSFPPSSSTSPKPTPTTFVNHTTSPAPGDILFLRSTKFKKGLTTVRVGGAGENALVGVVSAWDEKKKKVHFISAEAGGGGGGDGVVEGAWRIDELRAGEVQVFRVLPMSWA